VRFEVGQTIVRRALRADGRIAAVETARVVSDGDEGLLTWTAPGAQVMRRTTLDGHSIRRMPLAERDVTPTILSPGVWTDTGVLIRTRAGEAHSVWWFFAPPAWEFLGWYVNLERPGERWAGGVDVRDHALDVWVEPDRTWRWKDEDEFAERVGHPEYWTAAEAEGIRAEGERVITMVETGVSPFDGALTDFHPDPDWPPTLLPPHWDHPAR
jgi:hypothetical protein